MQDLVSIITPTYNSTDFISETIQSVLSQTHQNWEMLIVDDCSTDTTIDVIRSFSVKESRIRLFTLEKNSGAGVARNFAIQQAKGRYIAFLDADDLWRPEKLTIQLYFLKQNNTFFTHSYYDCIDEDGNDLKRRVKCPLNLKYYQLFLCNYVGNLTGIYDTHFFGKVPISSIRRRQDWIMWLSLLQKTRTIATVPESLAFYRVRSNSISSSKIKLIKDNYQVYRQYHKLNVVTSMLCMVAFLGYHFTIKKCYVEHLK